ncbi:MAG: amino acid ABC transporter ATP-binding protein [Proteobacteria bacterium]|nr:amino acid ABC transporter ATP-binding protein [Pseudomonadota bacterium]
MSLQTNGTPDSIRSAVSDEVVIALNQVNKWYGEFHALKDIDLSVHKGERIVICGPSGSGKSTLIRCLNRLEEHQRGDIVVNGVTLDTNLKNIDAIRSDVGMVFQSFNLFPHLTVLENCTLAPIWVKSKSKREAEEYAMELLTRVKIPEQVDKYPGQLSGGQQQRVAIARALVTRPLLILADEPTGALDTRTSLELMVLFQDLNRQGMTVVVVTHESDIARFAARLLRFRDGHLVEDLQQAPVDAAKLLAAEALPA